MASDARFSSFGLNSSEEIPSVMETVGFDLAPFDAASGMAGAMKIAGVVLRSCLKPSMSSTLW
ncbi:MAG: hypothetical protein F2520_04695 [Actinobacteria bacterium]|uniref:Unannotated protein n=1 Tax=freshwater metagenome TaxID=449393 RepID=A0A6J5YEV9_9ZZZZ|nr:hypothetical protein [Actinomycetota bacterium]MTA77540.1 hypothetical protein [Actinomycetota bacterium]